MQKMQEEEFNKIEASCKPEDCKHLRIVKLYELGTHSDYGCLDCKMKSFAFDTIVKEQRG